ncbi:hypothetical protein ABC337_04825 [Arthrobacter sp. 1P04PC]|uniref:hypothetical protein n=1 Tax=unclassified Arthrobacter TaxID=235627 RepID=UPI0039A249D8
MIPDEAVEAALSAWADRKAVFPRDVARHMLEAAAPHLIPSRNLLINLIADAYGDKNNGHLSVKAADNIRAALSEALGK